MIEYKNVSKSYGKQKVVKELNLKIPDGEFVVLIGPSGCGKTTTLKMLNRLIEMDSGSISIDGKNIMEMNPEKLRSRIGYVIQQIGLFPNMTVEENICVVPRLLKWDKEKSRQRAKELLEMVNMPYETYAHKYPNEMSGGQQQRIGVLRALAAEPPIILMDEPFGALDPITRDSLQDEVKSLQQRLGKTVIFVTHDMDEALKMADTVVFMSEGRILQTDSPEGILRAPANDTVREFMGKHVHNFSQNQLACSDLMKTNVAKVTQDKKTLECVNIMSRREIDSLVVVDREERYIGVLLIETVNERGKAGDTIRDLITADFPTVAPDTPAKTAFDIISSQRAEYVVVLTEDKKVAGIITKTSMSKALASVVWGDGQ
ncbi:ABC transporter ATP-binding protein [Caproiciproducens sp. CPB-2]|uniref:ABC transporter ATP-binding protein n=1 Tax=Caproiciproducens sp. CPB-2 TaxID=3030017 RepID=UPI0023DA499B|nr:ABC transporter ATP-binding protein [Caproiciproducens sp. CPB-2]MDF1494662.1 ABC transporter ATP-binding protein [Caproiciproducens sp. CPB-2]